MTEYHHFIINHWTDDLKQQSVEMSMVNLVTHVFFQFLKQFEAFEVQFLSGLPFLHLIKDIDSM